MWGTLHALGLAERTVLWNAFAWHPFKPGEPYSNRAPTRDELEAGRAVLDAVLAPFASARIVAVGKVAERTLRKLGREPDATVRHPSMGGATEFRAGLAALAAKLGWARTERRAAGPARGERLLTIPPERARLRFRTEAARRPRTHEGTERNREKYRQRLQNRTFELS